VALVNIGLGEATAIGGLEVDTFLSNGRRFALDISRYTIAKEIARSLALVLDVFTIVTVDTAVTVSDAIHTRARVFWYVVWQVWRDSHWSASQRLLVASAFRNRGLLGLARSRTQVVVSPGLGSGGSIAGMVETVETGVAEADLPTGNGHESLFGRTLDSDVLVAFVSGRIACYFRVINACAARLHSFLEVDLLVDINFLLLTDCVQLLLDLLADEVVEMRFQAI